MHNGSCVNQPSPQCGTAHGLVFSEPPSSNLCDEWTASDVYDCSECMDLWNYTWTCSTGEVSTGCMAYAQAECWPATEWGPMDPSDLRNLYSYQKCSVGVPADWPTPWYYDTGWNWMCTNPFGRNWVSCWVDVGCPENYSKVYTNPAEGAWECMPDIVVELQINNYCGEACEGNMVSCDGQTSTYFANWSPSYCTVTYPYTMMGQKVEIDWNCRNYNYPGDHRYHGEFEVPDPADYGGMRAIPVIVDVQC